MRRILGLLMVAMLGFAGACSDDVGSRDDVVKKFTDEGIDPAMAGCLADAAIAEFGLDTLNENRELTDEEEEQLGDMLLGCASSTGADDVEVDLDDVDCSQFPDAAAREACEDGLAELEDLEEEMDEG